MFETCLYCLQLHRVSSGVSPELCALLLYSNGDHSGLSGTDLYFLKALGMIGTV